VIASAPADRDVGVVAPGKTVPPMEAVPTPAGTALRQQAGLLARLARSRWVAPLLIALATTFLFHAIVAFCSPLYWTRSSWDEEYYLAIARQGYVLPNDDFTQFSNLPFSPGWPLLLRVASAATGLDPLVLRTPLAAVLFVIAGLGLASALAAFSSNLRRNNAVLLLFALWPPSLYFRSGYAEALYLPVLAWFFAFLLRRRWLPAACCVALALAIRTPAVVLLGTLVCALGLDAFATRPFGPAVRALAVRAALLVPLALLGLVAYAGTMWVQFGDPFAFVHAYVAWGFYDTGDLRSLRLETVGDTIRLYPGEHYFDSIVLQSMVSFLLVPLIVWPLRTCMPAILTVFTAGAWLFFLARDWIAVPFHDMFRWMAVVFPVHYCLVLWTDRLPALRFGGRRLDLRVPAYWLLVLGFAVGFVLYVEKFIKRSWVS
jgi:hypothetical protein